MFSQKVVLFLALFSLGFFGSFILSLVLPGLISSGSDSLVSASIGVGAVRLILFFASCICLFGIGPYLVINFYKINRLETTTTHYIRNWLQVLTLDIENASMTAVNGETLRFLSHAFEACRDMSMNLPKQIDREAATFNALKAKKETKRINSVVA